MLRLVQGQTTLKMGFEVRPDLGMPLFRHAARDAAPHDPKFHPHRLFLMKRYSLGKQDRCLLTPPFIQWIADARTQRIADKLEPNPLVVGRSAAARGCGIQPFPQFAQQRHAPVLTRSQAVLETPPKLLGLGLARTMALTVATVGDFFL